MSKVALTGNNSGTGVFTIAAPNSNTDRTLTLPDEAGTVLSSGTPLSSFPSGFANGITEFDRWSISSSNATLSSGGSVLTANMVRVGTQIGTGMSESSGTFTFPSTGTWLVVYRANFDANSSNTSRLENSILVGGSTVSFGNAHVESGQWASAIAIWFGNISNTSTQTVTFITYASVNGPKQWFLSGEYSSFDFIKFGD